MKDSGEVENNVHNIFRVVPEFFSGEGKFLCLDSYFTGGREISPKIQTAKINN